MTTDEEAGEPPWQHGEDGAAMEAPPMAKYIAAVFTIVGGVLLALTCFMLTVTQQIAWLPGALGVAGAWVVVMATIITMGESGD